LLGEPLSIEALEDLRGLVMADRGDLECIPVDLDASAQHLRLWSLGAVASIGGR
jgi:hypothetical protein